MTSILKPTGEKLCDKYSVNLKFLVWKEDMSCALKKIISKRIYTVTDIQRKVILICGNATVFAGEFIFFVLPPQIQCLWPSNSTVW